MKTMREWLVGLVNKYGKDARLVDVARMEKERVEKEDRNEHSKGNSGGPLLGGTD